LRGPATSPAAQGDDVVLIGLFPNRYGDRRNLPIVRAGIIAAMPEEKFRFRGKWIDAYLIETRSIGGLSGSPVFLYRYGSRSNESQTWLLGVVRGHYGAVSTDIVDAEDAGVETANMGISVVTPAEKLFTLLDQVRHLDEADEDIELRFAGATQAGPAQPQ